MPKPANGDEFLDLVRKSGLVEGERLAAFMNKIRGAMALAPVTHLQPLAEMLVREGLLSSFQADCLRHGKWQGFSIVDNKVLEKIGSGSMGSVYLCESNRMKCVVAVKVLPTALEARDPVARQRFCREARAGAAVAHVNIAAVYEFGEHDKICYIGMEYVDGSTLQQIVQTSGPLEPLRAARYMSEVATGLVQVHSRGIIHRDIEPNNIIVDRRGNVKIVDFGLARAIDDASLEGPGLTDKQIASLFGTADYLAPEVASGKGASAGASARHGISASPVGRRSAKARSRRSLLGTKIVGRRRSGRCVLMFPRALQPCSTACWRRIRLSALPVLKPLSKCSRRGRDGRFPSRPKTKCRVIARWCVACSNVNKRGRENGAR
jgi:serine/threonine protein kinase